MPACLVFESLVVEVKASLVQNEGGNAPRQGPVMKRQTRRITDCMDCWKRGWCFLFFEQWPDGTPRGIWLCSDCIDRRPPALH